MKNAVKSALIASAMLAASASASVVVDYNSDATAGEAAFMAFLAGPTAVENFDTYGGAAVYGGTDQSSWENHMPTLATNVGTFDLITAGQDGKASDPNLFKEDLMIESAQTGEYGRQSLSTYNNDLWLDSNDAEKVTWTFDSPSTIGMNAFGFYIADASDVGATLTLLFNDGSYSDAYSISPQQSSGNLGYVSVKSSMSIAGATLSFQNSNDHDGWGIDDITVGKLPEPGSLLLLGLGLLGLGAARRRVKA